MKLVLFLTLLLIIKNCSCQIGDSKIECKIIFYNPNVSSILDNNFILKMSNYSDSIFELPILLEVGPEDGHNNYDIGFQIFLCNQKDTIDIVRKINGYHSQLWPIENRFKFNYIYRYQDFLYEVRIPNFFLDKKGVYRVRLIFHSEKFLKNFQPCKTDWVYISKE